MTHDELIKQLQTIQSQLNDANTFECWNRGTSCSEKYNDQVDKEGRAIYFFDTTCRVVETFCPPCAAYWHVAVSVNKLFADKQRVMSREHVQARKAAARTHGISQTLSFEIVSLDSKGKPWHIRIFHRKGWFDAAWLTGTSQLGDFRNEDGPIARQALPISVSEFDSIVSALQKAGE